MTVAHAPGSDRLFFALWPDADLRRGLAGLASEARHLRGGRCMRAETLHLTLAFIGQHPRARLPELLALAAALHVAPFDFCLDRMGAWDHGRLLWAGCAQPVSRLEDLAGRLGHALLEQDVVPQLPPFVPHVTLVRKARPEGNLPPVGVLRWRAREFVLVRSVLSAAGPSYEPVGRWALCA